MAQRAGRNERFQRDGFFVARGVLDAQQVGEFTDACDHALAQVRAASRSTGHLTTHISGFLVPEYYRDRPRVLDSLVEFASSPAVLSRVADLGRPGEGAPALRDVQYFHEPSLRDYDGAWHRDGDDAVVDDGPPPALRPTLVRYRVALAADDHLEYLPGSHVRPDTDEELRLRKGMVRNGPPPAGAQRIALGPGDVLVFDAWGIHRARYRHDVVRRSLDLLFGFGPRKRADLTALQEVVRSARTRR